MIENLDKEHVLELERFSKKAWTIFRYHKDMQNKIIFWLASFFVAFLGAMNYIGLTGKIPNAEIKFWHLFFVHSIFLTGLFFYMHHRLCGYIYVTSANLADHVLSKKYVNLYDDTFIKHFRIRHEWTKFGGGDGFTKRINWLKGIGIPSALMIYVLLILSPLPVVGELDVKGVYISWEPLSLLFTLGCIALLYSAHKKAAIKHIKAAWQKFFQQDSELSELIV